MTRSTRAARRLISELQPFVPDLDVEEDDTDGLGVHRTLRLRSAGYKGIADVVSAVEDPRIVNTRAVTGGVEITFTHTIQADRGSTWNVRDAAHLIGKRPAKKTASSWESTKKKAAKKTATKKTAAKKAAPKDAD